MNTQFKKGALELCVLSQLRKADKYGYELTETISREMELATGTLYLTSNGSMTTNMWKPTRWRATGVRQGSIII